MIKIFSEHMAEQTQREQKCIPRYRFHRTTVFSHAWMPERLVQWESLLWRQVYRPPVRGWMCLQDRNRAASSSWSPAAMAVTRTSSSAELMASDKCVMGELSGPEVHGSSFYERETLRLSAFYMDGLSHYHRGRVCIPVSLDNVLSHKGLPVVRQDFLYHLAL